MSCLLRLLNTIYESTLLICSLQLKDLSQTKKLASKKRMIKVTQRSYTTNDLTATILPTKINIMLSKKGVTDSLKKRYLFLFIIIFFFFFFVLCPGQQVFSHAVTECHFFPEKFFNFVLGKHKMKRSFILHKFWRFCQLFCFQLFFFFFFNIMVTKIHLK